MNPSTEAAEAATDANPLGLTQDTMGEIVAYSFQAAQLKEVHDLETSEAARVLRAQLKALDTKIDAARVSAKAPYLQQGKLIDGLAKVITDMIRPEIKRLDDLRLEYSRRFSAPPAPVVTHAYLGARLAPDAFGDVSAEVPDMSALATGVETAPPKIRTMTRDDVEVYDLAQIPREFLVVDTVALRKAVLTEGRSVPGARIIQKTTVLE